MQIIVQAIGLVVFFWVTAALVEAVNVGTAERKQLAARIVALEKTLEEVKAQQPVAWTAAVSK